MKPVGSIETLVIARPERVGDVVLSSSCLPAVRQHFPSGSLHWMVPARMHPLFCAPPLVDGVIASGEGSFWQRLGGLRRTLRALRPDAVALLQPDRAIEIASWLAGVRIRAGFARLRCGPQLLTHAVRYRKSDGVKHEAESNFEVLNLLGVPTPAALQAVLCPDPAARARLKARLETRGVDLARCAVLHLAAHGAKRRVPREVFGALAGWLNRNYGLRVILVGTEMEPPAARLGELAGLAAADIVDLRGSGDLAETAWLLREAACCAARDSGPAHVAAAQGCPTLTFFVDMRPLAGPRRWLPLGPCVEAVSPGSDGFDFAAVQTVAARLLKRGRTD